MKKRALTKEEKQKVKNTIFSLKENGKILVPEHYVNYSKDARFDVHFLLTRNQIKKLLKQIQIKFEIKFSKSTLSNPKLETINDLHSLISQHLNSVNTIKDDDVVKKRKRTSKNIILYCISCNCDITRIFGKNSNQLWRNMYEGGIVDKISAGYGSLLDGNMYVIAICDKCLEEKVEKGVVKYVGNYMLPKS